MLREFACVRIAFHAEAFDEFDVLSCVLAESMVRVICNTQHFTFAAIHWVDTLWRAPRNVPLRFKALSSAG
jgi:hypothetical protein